VATTPAELSRKWKALVTLLERQAVYEANLPAEEHSKYCGRAKGVRLLWRPLIGPVPSDVPHLSAQGMAAKCLVTRLALLIALMSDTANLGSWKLVDAWRAVRAFDCTALPAGTNISAYLREDRPVECLRQLREQLKVCVDKEAVALAKAKRRATRLFFGQAMSNGARLAHRLSKQPCPELVSGCSSLGQPYEPQQRAEAFAVEYDEHWNTTLVKPTAKPEWSWPQSLGKLTPIDVQGWRSELRTLRHTLGLGLDALHPRSLDMLGDADLQLAAQLVQEMEDVGSPPDMLDVVSAVFIPKKDGGKRPIGLGWADLRVGQLAAGAGR
jgi:hypothetical protein